MNETQSKAGGNAPRAAVIGSGFGGLAAAIRLQSAGFQTVVFEARDKPGGRAYVYEQDGFVFDGGPTVITAPTCLEELFALSGRKLADYVELIPVSPLYRLIWSDGDRMDYVASADAMAEQIRQRNPADAEGFRRFVAYTSEVFHKGYQGLAATPFLRFVDMVRVAPQLIKLRADRSVYATVARYVQHEHVRQALSFHSLLVGGNPYDTSSIYTLIHYLERNWGVYFPRGGTGALVRALVKLFEELGGEIRLSTSVRRAELQRDGGVRHVLTTVAGARESFDLVVSNADLPETYGPLHGDLPEAEAMRGRLNRLAWSMSLFVLYFGTDRVYVTEKKEDRIFQSPLEFERVEYRVREGRRRSIKLFAMHPDLVARETEIEVVSSDANRVAVRGKCRLIPVQGTNYAEGVVHVEGRTLKSSAQITAQLKGVAGSATVKVVEHLESGVSVSFDVVDQDFGNFRARWAYPEGRPNQLLVAARHDSLSRYLGDPAKDFPGQSSPLFRALLAEIVAESVCRKALALETRERPFDFRWADMGKPEEIVDDVFAQFQQRQREFLAHAHEIMLGQEELNSVTAGTGSQK